MARASERRLHLVFYAALCGALAAVVVAPACSRSASRCSANGVTLHISASNSRFDTDCLAAPPGTPFTISFDNKDGGVTHDVLISVAFDPGAKVLFDGTDVTGPRTVVYHVGALAAGSYSFECSLHPGFMHGTLIVAVPASSSDAASP